MSSKDETAKTHNSPLVGDCEMHPNSTLWGRECPPRYSCPFCMEDFEIDFSWVSPIAWEDFYLNPRQLRGSDFLMRWSQGEWSEKRLVDAVNETGSHFAVHYGPSGVAPSRTVREAEEYFERLDKAGLKEMKRPDLLIFDISMRAQILDLIDFIGGPQELPFLPEDNANVQTLLSLSMVAIECENSLWKARKMPDYGSTFKPQRRLGGKYGLKKSAVLPTVIVKEEDRAKLLAWQNANKVPIHIWHVFYDLAYGIPLDNVENLINNGDIQPTIQVFQAPGGPTTSKTIYKIYYQYAYELAESTAEPTLLADFIEDKNGHILPYVRFTGGKLVMLPQAMEVLRSLKRA